MYKPIIFGAFALLGVLSISNCSSSSGGSGATATTLAALPAATGPVSSSSSVQKLDLQTDATTGVKMSEWNSTTWTSPKSGAMCEVGQMVLRLLSEASQPDKILCYVGAMEANGAFTASYDGNNHFYSLAGAGGDGRPDPMKIKFNITKSGNAITNFKMWMCQSSSRAYAQSEYVSTSLSNGTATVTSVGVHTGDFGSGSQRTVASGGFNSSGTWTSKTIEHTHNFAGGSGGSAFKHAGVASLTQGSDSFTLSGYNSGYFGGSSNSQSGRMYAVIQGIGLSNLSTAALGSGTAKFAFTFTGGGGGTDTKSWQGDTQLSEASSTASYFSTVNAATLPTAETITAPTFSGDEIWDCTAGTSTFESLSLSNGGSGLSTALAACNTKYGFTNNNMVNCSAGKFD